MVMGKLKRGLMNIIGATLVGIASVLPCNVRGEDEICISNVGGSGIGGQALYVEHKAGSIENGTVGVDDSIWSAPSSPYDQWVTLYSKPYGTELSRDSRPTNSYTTFNVKGRIVDYLGDNVTSTNYLLFNFISGDTNRAYSADFNMNTNYTPGNIPFNWKGIVTNGTRINTPGISNAPDGAEYFTLDLISLMKLKVVSAHGTPVPGTTNNVPYGNVVTQSIESVVTNSGTRYTNKGYNLKAN